uniref:FAD-binding domain-containing protein n=1 Tax=Oryza punctata TaxID=4537 RepID=A0A0E0K8X5_ORYPU
MASTILQQKGAGEDAVVVVGAGIAGLAVALGLHRKGVKCSVLESSPELRASGFAIATWRNALQALDALGVGNKIRKCHLHLQEGPNEMLCVRRDWLLRALEEELPEGTIRYSSKIVEIEEDGDAKILHLGDGTILRSKVLIGCDGVNSVVAKWLGLAKPSYSGRLATRGLACYPGGHGFDPKFKMFFGHGFRVGVIPCNDTDVYWFFTWSPSEHDDDALAKKKQFVLTKLRSAQIPTEVLEVVERSEAKHVLTAPLRFRPPVSLLLASISKGNVCVAGDALHPMTPDLGQGGCAALEDGVVLARCLGDAILGGSGAESERIEAGLREYARIRRWRSAELIGTAYAVGFMQESSNGVISFLRDNWLAGALQERADGREIVIAGAGLAGLAVALGLHRKGLRSLVLESSPTPRTSGFAFITWTNAFRALDALGVGDKMRSQHQQIQRLSVMSSATGEIVQELDLRVEGKRGPHEARCVSRTALLLALEEELPRGTIRYSSKIVSIEEHGNDKILHLSDGSTLRAKVLIGCDGINSVVARWLGLAKPSDSGRTATRGRAKYPDGHGFEPRLLLLVGQGFRAGMLPCNNTDVYWFFTWSPSPDGKDVDKSAAAMKQFVLTKLRSTNVPPQVLEAVERSEMNDVLAAPLRFRSPLSLPFASISKGNVCVAGDALHPTTPDLAQGACTALEDAVVLARCLGEALLLRTGDGAAEERRVEAALRRYADARRWRSAQLTGASYAVGFVQQSDHPAVGFLRDKLLSGVLAKTLLMMPDYDCGTLSSSATPMEGSNVEGIVIAGAGLAGLATALGLHRKGVRSLVLESSETLRASGFAFTTWTNAFRALDALGVGDKIREHHVLYERLVAFSASTGEPAAKVSLKMQGKSGPHEIRSVKRNFLLETLENELPEGTIRFSSKIVSIEEEGNVKLLHLADGSTIRAKVLIGCDGVNSVVAKWLGLPKPILSGRSATRGLAEYPAGHGFGPEILQFIGQGFRSGVLPCSDTSVYWNYTWYPSPDDGDAEESVAKMRSYVLAKLTAAKIPVEALDVIERSEMSDVVSSPLRFRSPLALVRGSISRGNVCVAGDAFHPTTPELGQGGCAALEDGVVLARCLSEAFLADGAEHDPGYEAVTAALEKYAEERRWRGIRLITAAYVVGFIQQSNNPVIKFLREKFLSGLLAKTMITMADYDCGKL